MPFSANFNIMQCNIFCSINDLLFVLFFGVTCTIKAHMCFAKRFFHVFALIAAFMQVSAHLAPVLAEATGAMQITICSGYGSRTITIDQNGQQVPEIPQSLKKNCAVCALTHVAAITPTITRIEPVKHAIVRIDIVSDTPLFKTQLAKAHQTRGPPPLS